MLRQPKHEWVADARRRRILVDALLLVTGASTADAIVEDALAMAARETVPPIADGLRAFVSGHLLDAVEARLGPDAADAIEDSLDAILRTAEHDEESAPAPRRGERGRLVLVASSDPERTAQIARALSTHADVESIDDAGVIPALLWARLATAIVIDWARSPLEPALLDEIVAGAGDVHVVLWGAPAEVEDAFAGAKGTWIGCGSRASARHVAGIVLALITHG